MRHTRNNRLMLMACLLAACSLAFVASLAQAESDSGLGGINVLMVNVSANEGDSDIRATDTRVDLYRIATGTKNPSYDSYDYAFDIAAFKDLGDGYDPSFMTSDSWQRMADVAKAIVQEKGIRADATAKTGERVAGLADGIYLVLVPEATTGRNTYSFVPALVALPGKVGADGAPVYNTASGRWANADPVVPVPVTVKWSRTPRYGSLRIDKTVRDFKGEAATFVYHITDVETGGKVYENYAAVQYTAEGTKGITVGHIPAGIELAVTEEYTGARHRLVSEATQTVTVVADESVRVEFENEPDNTGTGGHGIENHFVFDEGRGDWHLEVHAVDASENASGA